MTLSSNWLGHHFSACGDCCVNQGSNPCKVTNFLHMLYKELVFNEQMLYDTSAIINQIDGNGEYIQLAKIIKETLTAKTFDLLFSKWREYMRDDFSLLNFFTTTVITSTELNKLFSNMTTVEAYSYEIINVVALEIDGKIVLLEHSDRGSGIRVQVDKNYELSFDKVCSIVRKLCLIYNKLC